MSANVHAKENTGKIPLSRYTHSGSKSVKSQRISFYVDETSGTKWRVKRASTLCVWYLSKRKINVHKCQHYVLNLGSRTE